MMDVQQNCLAYYVASVLHSSSAIMLTQYIHTALKLIGFLYTLIVKLNNTIFHSVRSRPFSTKRLIFKCARAFHYVL